MAPQYLSNARAFDLGQCRGNVLGAELETPSGGLPINETPHAENHNSRARAEGDRHGCRALRVYSPFRQMTGGKHFIFALAVLAATSVSAAPDSEDPPANPAFQPPDRELFDQGGYVYERNCLVCHGDRGDGKGEMAATMTIKPRSFRDAQFKYRSTPWGKLPTTDDLIRTIRNGRTGTAMGAFTHLRESDVRAVAEYVKLFSRKWRKPENYALPVELPPEPAWLRDSSKLEQHAAEGRKVFLTTCATCHGESADGKGPAAAALKDDLGQPAQPADLRELHLRSGDEPIDIYRVLMTGLNGTPRVSFAEALSTENKWDVVAFILKSRAERSAEPVGRRSEQSR